MKKAEFPPGYLRFAVRAGGLKPGRKMRGGFRLYALIVFA
jgi:hypothetical protein